MIYTFRHTVNSLKTDTFGTGTKCPSYGDVRLMKRQIKGISKGRDQLYRCPFYRGVRLIEVSVKRVDCIFEFTHALSRSVLATCNIDLLLNKKRVANYSRSLVMRTIFGFKCVI